MLRITEQQLAAYYQNRLGPASHRLAAALRQSVPEAAKKSGDQELAEICMRAILEGPGWGIRSEANLLVLAAYRVVFDRACVEEYLHEPALAEDHKARLAAFRVAAEGRVGVLTAIAPPPGIVAELDKKAGEMTYGFGSRVITNLLDLGVAAVTLLELEPATVGRMHAALLQFARDTALLEYGTEQQKAEVFARAADFTRKLMSTIEARVTAQWAAADSKAAQTALANTWRQRNVLDVAAYCLRGNETASALLARAEVDRIRLSATERPMDAVETQPQGSTAAVASAQAARAAEAAPGATPQ